MTLTPLDPDVVAAHLRPPALADLARAARRRKRRRRVAGAAAVLATAAAATLLLPVGSGQPEPPAITDLAQPRPTQTYTSPVLAGSPTFLYTVVLDRENVVAFGRLGCFITVQRTTDGGRTWTAPGSPPPEGESCKPGAEGPFDQTVLDVDTYWVPIDGRGWFTTDAGRTWTPAPADREVGQFPPGRPGATLECGLKCDRPRAVDPTTGGLVALRVEPPFTQYDEVDWADADTIWAVESPRPGRTKRASRSADQGRTWSKPFDLPVKDGGDLVPTGPRRAYFTKLTDTGIDLWRTDDGGQTWTELAVPMESAFGVTETATGVLIASSSVLHGVAAWVSTDRGRTFTGPVTMTGPNPRSGGLAGGLVFETDGDHVTHVFDGTGWYEIPPPR